MSPAYLITTVGGAQPGPAAAQRTRPGSLSPRKDGWGMGRPWPGLQGAVWSSRAVCFTEVEGQMSHEGGQHPVPCLAMGMETLPVGVVLTGPNTPIQ